MTAEPQPVPDAVLTAALGGYYHHPTAITAVDPDVIDGLTAGLAAGLAAITEEARQNDGGPEIVQVCMHEVMLPAFKAWLAGRDLRLFPIPVENNLPTYGIRGTS